MFTCEICSAELSKNAPLAGKCPKCGSKFSLPAVGYLYFTMLIAGIVGFMQGFRYLFDGKTPLSFTIPLMIVLGIVGVIGFIQYRKMPRRWVKHKETK
ncbi:hypothetical protein [Ponticaulis profundi]|uniref:Zinc ribbon domain-containing protein n=1 Tax=Ponticaulis profundi TaxID=2665222 RepID=A0ABW1S917_9PROT